MNTLLAAILPFSLTLQLGAQAPASEEKPPPKPAEAQAPSGGAGGHGEVDELTFDSRDYTPEQLIRLEKLYSLIVCKCPRENWTKSLAGCPEGCALEQKVQVRQAVKAGKTDEEILAEQVKLYGPQVLARTPAEGLAGFYLYLLPFLCLAFFAIVMVLILRRLTRRTARPEVLAGQTPAPAAAPSREDEEWSRKIEQELQEME